MFSYYLKVETKVDYLISFVRLFHTFMVEGIKDSWKRLEFNLKFWIRLVFLSG